MQNLKEIKQLVESGQISVEEALSQKDLGDLFLDLFSNELGSQILKFFRDKLELEDPELKVLYEIADSNRENYLEFNSIKCYHFGHNGVTTRTSPLKIAQAKENPIKNVMYVPLYQRTLSFLTHDQEAKKLYVQNLYDWDLFGTSKKEIFLQTLDTYMDAVEEVQKKLQAEEEALLQNDLMKKEFDEITAELEQHFKLVGDPTESFTLEHPSGLSFSVSNTNFNVDTQYDPNAEYHIWPERKGFFESEYVYLPMCKYSQILEQITTMLQKFQISNKPREKNEAKLFQVGTLDGGKSLYRAYVTKDQIWVSAIYCESEKLWFLNDPKFYIQESKLAKWIEEFNLARQMEIPDNTFFTLYRVNDNLYFAFPPTLGSAPEYGYRIEKDGQDTWTVTSSYSDSSLITRRKIDFSDVWDGEEIESEPIPLREILSELSHLILKDHFDLTSFCDTNMEFTSYLTGEENRFSIQGSHLLLNGIPKAQIDAKDSIYLLMYNTLMNQVKLGEPVIFTHHTNACVEGDNPIESFPDMSFRGDESLNVQITPEVEEPSTMAILGDLQARVTNLETEPTMEEVRSRFSKLLKDVPPFQDLATQVSELHQQLEEAQLCQKKEQLYNLESKLQTLYNNIEDSEAFNDAVWQVLESELGWEFKEEDEELQEVSREPTMDVAFEANDDEPETQIISFTKHQVHPELDLMSCDVYENDILYSNYREYQSKCGRIFQAVQVKKDNSWRIFEEVSEGFAVVKDLTMKEGLVLSYYSLVDLEHAIVNFLNLHKNYELQITKVDSLLPQDDDQYSKMDFYICEGSEDLFVAEFDVNRHAWIVSISGDKIIDTHWEEEGASYPIGLTSSELGGLIYRTEEEIFPAIREYVVRQAAPLIDPSVVKEMPCVTGEVPPKEDTVVEASEVVPTEEVVELVEEAIEQQDEAMDEVEAALMKEYRSVTIISIFCAILILSWISTWIYLSYS